MNIVLLEPEIAPNTGNIGRSCVATNTTLHLIEPLGFKIDDKSLKRAGLDYWHALDLKIYENYNDFLNKNNNPTVFMATTKSTQTYCDVSYKPDSFIMFGKESKGIPEELLINNKENCIRIPMIGQYRSLNLSNSVSIVLFESLRQNNFLDFQTEGTLHNLTWKG